MSISQCGVCHEQESKYKCPICELRYCSLICYRTHKLNHTDEKATVIQQAAARQRDRPGTKHRVPKVDLTGFEDDAEFKRLMQRYPMLQAQLQVAYGLTLEPSPEDKFSWSRGPLLGALDPSRGRSTRGRGNDRRGGRGGRGSRGGRGGRHDVEEASEERQRGAWTQDKGDKEALLAIKKMKTGGERDEKAEGMREFVELCQMRFGSGRADKGEAEFKAVGV
ncbi:hypothetical protein LTR78_005010 [Recurvomyces mirabilis]|uniref:HIT-type domain-containing protein n=1 Tax=Recurvomyces mirabilis TaxID=574656 RepID=A0AAE1C203_9PEZI|nr:hypothetical protein LTR78_005010 [Recurvomyces mirabilis]KAK5158374.1 hypothetical protein LTS14_003392 [Recurvomyces mirabilis]